MLWSEHCKTAKLLTVIFLTFLKTLQFFQFSVFSQRRQVYLTLPIETIILQLLHLTYDSMYHLVYKIKFL